VAGKRSERTRQGTGKRGRLLEYAESIFVAAVLFVFLRTFVLQAFQIPSGSMEDTLLVGDFLIANKFLYGPKIPWTDHRVPAIRQPRPGDIIVFRAPHVDKDFIKRCVAVERDTVEMRDNVLYVNGTARQEPYTVFKGSQLGSRSNWGPEVVPDGHIFMLGDNRNNSQDSRYWGFLDKKRIKGLALFLYFSWDKDRFLPRFERFLRPVR
jgi:signal peptidase I